MNIHIKNIGVIRQATFKLSNMTIICGNNNTGKTYATYALYGFLSYWYGAFFIKLKREKIESLFNDGILLLNFDEFINDRQKYIDIACKEYVKRLPFVFSSSNNNFKDSEFRITLSDNNVSKQESYKKIMGTSKKQLVSISKEQFSETISISLLVDKENIDINYDLMSRIIGDALRDILFLDTFPKPYIASAERTGAAIFRKELNFERNRLIDQIGTDDPIDPYKIIYGVNQDYALPVRVNVDFTRRLESIAKQEGGFFKKHPDILEDFSDILGGEYYIGRHDSLYFIPKNKRIKLTMDESSSGVRSLLDIGFYIRNVIDTGDLLVIDEPELNLHPDNQRKLARLFARLVNLGIRIFITTHSDYIIRELNTLLMLNSDNPRIQELSTREGYKNTEILNKEKISVYIAEKALINDGSKRKKRCQTLIEAEINEFGIKLDSFDSTIAEMNRIQDEIIWGGK